MVSIALEVKDARRPSALAATVHVLAHENVAALKTQLVQRGLADPDRLLVTTLDVASPSSVAAWAEAELAEVGHVDVVINNAGVLPARGKDIETVAAADMLEAFTVNTVGPVLVVQALVRAREWGCARRRAGGRAATDEDLHAPAGRDGAAERREAGRGAPEHRR